MQSTTKNFYALDPHIAEVYDQVESGLSDVEQIRRLIAPKGRRNLLEPFCGTGRILIPLIRDGHSGVGLDQAHTMLNRARRKLDDCGINEGSQIRLAKCDVTRASWPSGFDLVILGRNSLYELPSPKEQEFCIASAALSLQHGGFLYVDNNHIEGELDDSWRELGIPRPVLSGERQDGVIVEGQLETISFEAHTRIVRFRRRFRIIYPSSKVLDYETTQQKHPVSASEVRGWLLKHGFVILSEFGNYEDERYSKDSPRAIFWAVKSS